MSVSQDEIIREINRLKNNHFGRAEIRFLIADKFKIRSCDIDEVFYFLDCNKQSRVKEGWKNRVK